MLKVGRNDTCPCGSGKKYKKCCEQKEVVSITAIVDRELVEVQNDIINFSYENFKSKIEGILNTKFKEFDIHEDQETLKMFTFLGWAWFIFTQPIKGKKRIIDLYLDENMNKTTRLQTKEILRTWSEGKSTVSRLVAKEDYEILIEDIFTKEKKKVKLLSRGTFNDFRIGSLLMGVLVPHGETYLYFIECTGVEDRKGKEEELTHRIYRDTQIEDPEEFLQEDFPFVLGMIVLDPPDMEITSLDIDINNIHWVNPVYEMIADAFLVEMKDQPDYMANLGILIWKTYTERKEPAIKSPQIAVAALHYIMDDLFTKTHTQKSLAEHYGVTTGGISARYRSIYDAVDDVISLIYEEIIGPERERPKKN